MSNFDNVQLRRLDMTLLLVLSEALRTRKLGTVAVNLGLTPSAISHALGRLRDIFGDPLFVRRPTGVESTPRALALAPHVARALEALNGALQPPQFDPAQLQRTFRIAALDALITIDAPSLIDTVRIQAPGVRLAFINLGRQEAFARLAATDLDLAIGTYPIAARQYARTVLGTMRFVTVARHGHPKLSRGMTLPVYLALDHIMVSGVGEFTGTIDAILARQRKARRVVAAVPQFLASLATVAQSDFVASLPSGIADRYAKLFALDVYDCPVAVPAVELVAVSTLSLAADPALQWLIGLLPRID